MLAATEALRGLGKDGANAAAALLEEEDWDLRMQIADVLGHLGADGLAHADTVAALLKKPQYKREVYIAVILNRVGFLQELQEIPDTCRKSVYFAELLQNFVSRRCFKEV